MRSFYLPKVQEAHLPGAFLPSPSCELCANFSWLKSLNPRPRSRPTPGSLPPGCRRGGSGIDERQPPRPRTLPPPPAPSSPWRGRGEQESSERLGASPSSAGPQVGLRPRQLPCSGPGWGSPHGSRRLKRGVNMGSGRGTRVRPWVGRNGWGGDSLGWEVHRQSLEAAFWEPCPFPGGCKFRREVSFQKNPHPETVPPWLLQPLLGGQHHLRACGERVGSGRGSESEMRMGGKTVG